MLQECFKHPNHVSVCLQEYFKHHNNIRSACCRSISNTSIMSGVYVAGVLQTPQLCQCIPNYVNVSPIISGVHIAGVLQTFQQYRGCILQERFKHPNTCQCMLQECFWSSKNILGYARTTPPHWLPSHHPLYFVSNTKITLLSHHYKHYHKQ